MAFLRQSSRHHVPLRTIRFSCSRRLLYALRALALTAGIATTIVLVWNGIPQNGIGRHREYTKPFEVRDEDMMSRGDDSWPGHVNSDVTAKAEKPNNSTTVITVWFNLNSPRHTLEEYEVYKKRFLRIEAPLVVFTSLEEVSKLKEWREGRPTTFITEYTQWAPPLVAYKQKYEDVQLVIDPSRAWGIHTLDLFGVWNSKAFYVGEAARRDYYSSDYFLYVDIGTFREEKRLQHWPNEKAMRDIFRKNDHSIFFESIIRYPKIPKLKEYTIDSDVWSKADTGNAVVAGCVFGGDKEAVLWWEKEYYRVHNIDIEKDFFIGVDENLMAKVAFMNWRRTIVFEARDPGLVQGCNTNEWFLFQDLLARKEDRPQNCNPDKLLRLNEEL